MATEFGEWLNRNSPGFNDDPAPENTGDLVADGTNYRDEYFQEDAVVLSGIGLDREDGGPWSVLEGTLAADIWESVAKLQNGEAVDGAFGAAEVGYTVYGIPNDVFAFLGTQIVGWMLEHVEPHRRTLDALCGSHEIVEAYAQSWRNISNECLSISSDWQKAVDDELAGWGGATANAYRDHAARMVDRLSAAGGAAVALAATVQKAAKVVEAVRTLVQDIVTSLLGALIGYSVELAITRGASACSLVGRVLNRISNDARRITGLVTRLVDALKDFVPYTKAIKTVVEALTMPPEEPAPA